MRSGFRQTRLSRPLRYKNMLTFDLFLSLASWAEHWSVSLSESSFIQQFSSLPSSWVARINMLSVQLDPRLQLLLPFSSLLRNCSRATRMQWSSLWTSVRSLIPFDIPLCSTRWPPWIYLITSRVRPIRVKPPMSDVPIFRRKNSDVRFRCLFIRSCETMQARRANVSDS